MRPSVTSPWLGLVGLAGLAVIALALLHDELSLVEAATRAVLLTVGLAVVERLLLPLCRALVGGTRSPQEPPGPG